MQRALRGYAEAHRVPNGVDSFLRRSGASLVWCASLVTPDGRCADRLSVPPDHHMGQACGASEPIASTTIRPVPQPEGTVQTSSPRVARPSLPLSPASPPAAWHLACRLPLPARQHRLALLAAHLVALGRSKPLASLVECPVLVYSLDPPLREPCIKRWDGLPLALWGAKRILGARFSAVKLTVFTQNRLRDHRPPEIESSINGESIL